MLDTVKATFDNGDVIITLFNAEVGREEMARYYLGQRFNIGSVNDSLHKCVKVEFQNKEGKFEEVKDAD